MNRLRYNNIEESYVKLEQQYDSNARFWISDKANTIWATALVNSKYICDIIVFKNRKLIRKDGVYIGRNPKYARKKLKRIIYNLSEERI